MHPAHAGSKSQHLFGIGLSRCPRCGEVRDGAACERELRPQQARRSRLRLGPVLSAFARSRDRRRWRQSRTRRPRRRRPRPQSRPDHRGAARINRMSLSNWLDRAGCEWPAELAATTRAETTPPFGIGVNPVRPSTSTTAQTMTFSPTVHGIGVRRRCAHRRSLQSGLMQSSTLSIEVDHGFHHRESRRRTPRSCRH